MANDSTKIALTLHKSNNDKKPDAHEHTLPNGDVVWIEKTAILTSTRLEGASIIKKKEFEFDFSTGKNIEVEVSSLIIQLPKSLAVELKKLSSVHSPNKIAIRLGGQVLVVASMPTTIVDALLVIDGFDCDEKTLSLLKSLVKQ